VGEGVGVNGIVTPEIIGVTGAFSKSLRQYLNNMLVKQDIQELHKSSHIGHCTHTAENTNVKVKVKVKQSHCRPWQALRLSDFKTVCT
jgi:hypothetical protein